MTHLRISNKTFPYNAFIHTFNLEQFRIWYFCSAAKRIHLTKSAQICSRIMLFVSTQTQVAQNFEEKMFE